MVIKIDMSKAKKIGHEIRRNLRENEFKPYDEIISKQIPGNNSQEAEQKRQDIRDKYATIQVQIDNSTNTDQIKQALGIQ